MFISRRPLLAAAASSIPLIAARPRTFGAEPLTTEELDRAAAGPLLRLDELSDPVTIESIELLRNGGEYLVRARSTDGAEAVIAGNSGWLSEAFPIFKKRVAAYLIGKDARKVKPLLEELLRPQITYKLQGLALWVCVAAAEMALLELLGRVSGKSIGELFGGVRKRNIAVYRASPSLCPAKQPCRQL